MFLIARIFTAEGGAKALCIHYSISQVETGWQMVAQKQNFGVLL